jgi:hypothetical protein
VAEHDRTLGLTDAVHVRVCRPVRRLDDERRRLGSYAGFAPIAQTAIT